MQTDARFDEMVIEVHHLGPPALGFLPVGMVSRTPLDYVHLVCLKVMRRLLLCWLKGLLRTRLCARKVSELSERLTALQLMCRWNSVGNLGLLQRFCGGKRRNSGSSHCTLKLLLCHIFCQTNSISTFLSFSVTISLLPTSAVFTVNMQ